MTYTLCRKELPEQHFDIMIHYFQSLKTVALEIESDDVLIVAEIGQALIESYEDSQSDIRHLTEEIDDLNETVVDMIDCSFQ